MTARENADDPGIVVAAHDQRSPGYVLDDLACKLPNAGRVEQLDHGAIMRAARRADLGPPPPRSGRRLQAGSRRPRERSPLQPAGWERVDPLPRHRHSSERSRPAPPQPELSAKLEGHWAVGHGRDHGQRSPGRSRRARCLRGSSPMSCCYRFRPPCPSPASGSPASATEHAFQSHFLRCPRLDSNQRPSD